MTTWRRVAPRWPGNGCAGSSAASLSGSTSESGSQRSTAWRATLPRLVVGPTCTSRLTRSSSMPSSAPTAATPVQMMKALAWRRSEDDATTEWAQARLRALRLHAEELVGAPVSWKEPRHPDPPTPWWEYVGMAGCALLALAFLGLLSIGAVSLAAHGLGVVLGWFD
jgi:hypothetical protein